MRIFAFGKKRVKDAFFKERFLVATSIIATLVLCLFLSLRGRYYFAAVRTGSGADLRRTESPGNFLSRRIVPGNSLRDYFFHLVHRVLQFRKTSLFYIRGREVFP